MAQLGVNIDHIATVRNARYRDEPAAGEPDPVRAAHEAELGGADGITIHLREDRRHIIDRDVDRLRELVRVRLNLEMAATDEMIEIARRVKPDTAMLVPEGRHEVTTEGGLDVARQKDRLHDVVARLKDGGMVVSAFIDADESAIDAAAEIGFDVCEIHTGPYAEAFRRTGGDLLRPGMQEALDAVRGAADRVRGHGMRCNAGHGLSHANVAPIASIDGVEELHIGHAIVSRAVFVGLRASVAEMVALIR